jgi:hypothetical protein
MFRFIYFLIFVVCLASCNSKIYFTPDVRSQLLKFNHPLDKVQFFLDRKITLTNENVFIDTNGNKLYTKKLIKFRQNTPGVYLSSIDTLVAIKFEKDSLNQLIFGTHQKPADNDHYRITAFKWVNDYGYINYGKNTYHILINDSYASLKIRSILLKRLDKRDTQKRTVKGIKI